MSSSPAKIKIQQPNRKLMNALQQNWQAEMLGFHTYGALAQQEHDPERKRILEHLAQAEARHAELWAGRITDLGGQLPSYTGGHGGETEKLHFKVGGPDLALRRLEIEESRDIAKYGAQLRDLGDEPSVAILKQVIEDEKEHYCELSNLIRGRYPQRPPTEKPSDPKKLLEEMLARRNEGRTQAGGWIGDAIYGVNDGLGSIFGIVSGVSGATLGNSKFVLLAGIAGMIASALSMGSGAYLASKSEREIYEAEVARERQAIEMNGAEARELLALYYQVKGLPEADALSVVEHIAARPEQLLGTLRRTPQLHRRGAQQSVVSALSGALSTAVGAFIPIIPFFFMSGYRAVIWAAIISLLAHFAVGAAKSLITVRSWWSSGIEMTLVGAIEGVVTFVIGIGIGRIAG